MSVDGDDEVDQPSQIYSDAAANGVIAHGRHRTPVRRVTYRLLEEGGGATAGWTQWNRSIYPDFRKGRTGKMTSVVSTIKRWQTDGF